MIVLLVAGGDCEDDGDDDDDDDDDDGDDDDDNVYGDDDDDCDCDGDGNDKGDEDGEDAKRLAIIAIVVAVFLIVASLEAYAPNRETLVQSRAWRPTPLSNNNFVQPHACSATHPSKTHRSKCKLGSNTKMKKNA